MTAETGTFWAGVVRPGAPCMVSIPPGLELCLLNAALDQSAEGPVSGRVVLYCAVGDEPPVAIIPFTIGQFESAKIELRFAAGDEVAFTAAGAAVGVHVSGYILGGFTVDRDGGAPGEGAGTE